MPLIETSVARRTSVAVGVILVVLFGALALRGIPVQLTPEVSQPQISVTTAWRGASPYEVEREVVQRQEEQLKNIDGLVEMKSQCGDSRGQVTLTFLTGIDLDATLLKVSNKLNQVKGLPDGADRPVITTVNTADSPIAWFMLEAGPGNQRDVRTYFDFAEDVIKTRLERVPGVALANVLGGRETELQVLVDPAQLAALGLTLPDLMRALDRENANISAGTVDEGKRRFTVRVLGELNTPEAVAEVVIQTPSGGRVFLGDVAETRMGFKKATSLARHNGTLSMAVNCLRASGANVLEVMAGIKAAVQELQEGPLAEQNLVLTQVYDETDYIRSAIDLVKQNLYIGGSLAVLVLLIFLRAVRPTLIIALAIPVSMVGTFLVMYLLGRSINVISLAGLAFAVGMVVDNGIVVLENIYRHLQLGKPRVQAAVDGTREVWGAVLASTLTTMAVFLPILFIQEEVGQLFRDIAIAITAAVGLSLVVSVTVIPSAAACILKADPTDAQRFGPKELFGLAPLFGWVTEGLASLVYGICSHSLLKIMTVAVLTVASVGMAVLLAPKAEYLPEGNRNLVIGFVLPPPGYNLDELEAIGMGMEENLLPLWQAEVDDPEVDGPPILRFYFVTFRRNVFLIAKTKDPTRVGELIPLLRKQIKTVPGAFGVAKKTSLFSRSLTEGRSINLEFSGADLSGLIRSGGISYGALTKAIPGSQIRPIPSLDLGNPEISITPDRVRLADLGFSVAELGTIVDALLDGAKATDVLVDGDEIDLTVMGTEGSVRGLEDLETLPLRTPGGRTVTLGSVARVAMTSGPEQINRVEGQRTITLNISPPETIALQQAMETVEKTVAGLRAKQLIPPGVSTRLAGAADKLTATFEVMKGNFLLAIVITYLLMASLFESFLYPLVILFSVPLAAGGGFLGLWLVNHYIALQPLDMLTMLGFIILVGTVVNNAILVVHKTLAGMREEGLAPNDALRNSVRTRIRPIFMSTTTTVCGMLPLILFPGAGSELYRGIGAVVVGGLALSTVFTLLLVPAVLSLFLGFAGLFRRQTAEDPAHGRPC